MVFFTILMLISHSELRQIEMRKKKKKQIHINEYKHINKSGHNEMLSHIQRTLLMCVKWHRP